MKQQWLQPAGGVLIIAATTLALGCEYNGYLPPKSNLGWEFVAYSCLGFEDPFCDDAEPLLIPASDSLSSHAPIGLGSRFGVSDGSAVSTERLTPMPTGGFEAKKVGIAAVVSASDFAHFDVRKPVEVVVTHRAPSGLFTNRVGKTAFNLSLPEDKFRAMLADAEGNALAGAYNCKWTTTDKAVISIQGSAHKNLVTFRIEGAGTATLRVELGDFSQDIDFNISQ